MSVSTTPGVIIKTTLYKNSPFNKVNQDAILCHLKNHKTLNSNFSKSTLQSEHYPNFLAVLYIYLPINCVQFFQEIHICIENSTLAISVNKVNDHVNSFLHPCMRVGEQVIKYLLNLKPHTEMENICSAIFAQKEYFN